MANMTFGVNIIPKDNTLSLGTSQNKWKINGVDDPKLTDTDTKVTAVGNHYTPAEDTSAKLSADASSSTAATWNSTSLVTGVDIKRDAKGHVVGVAVDSIKMPANPNSDTHRVIQVNGTQVLASNTTALNLKAGSNVAITDGGSGAITIAATDTNTWRPVSDSVSSTSSSDAASSKAVKTAYDLAASKTANTGTVTSVATGVGLTGGTITGSGTLKAKLRSETALTIDSAAATTTSGRVYPVAVDKTGYLAVNVPWTDNNTTYSAGTGLSLSGTTFSNSGVTSINNQTGAVSITPASIGAMSLTPPAIEFYTSAGSGHGGVLDFHYNGNNNVDYTTRIIEIAPGTIAVSGALTATKICSSNAAYPSYEFQNAPGTSVADIYYDIPSKCYTFRYDPNGQEEHYMLPASTGSGGHHILTDKSPVLVTQGGTGATSQEGARANLGALGSFATDVTFGGSATNFYQNLGAQIGTMADYESRIFIVYTDASSSPFISGHTYSGTIMRYSSTKCTGILADETGTAIVISCNNGTWSAKYLYSR